MANDEAEEKQGFCKRFCHLEYFRTLEGIDKLIEFVVVLFGLIFMASVSAINASAIKFFIFVHTTAWIFIIIHILLNVLGLFHRLPLIVISNLTYLILCSIAGLVFLICSSVTLSKYNDWQVKTGSAFGLIATVLFIVEAVYHFIQHRRGDNREEAGKAEAPRSQDEENRPSY